MSSDIDRADDLRMDAGALLSAVLARGVRIVLVTVLLLVATAAILLFVPKTYESSASLLVEPRDSIYTRAAMESPQTGPGTVNTEALMSSQIELIKSRDLLLEVIDGQNLRSVPEFSNAGFSPVGFLMRLVGRGPEPRSVDETVLANLTDRMTVIRERDSAVISVYVRSTDAELAARIANAIAAAHVKRRAAQSIADTADATVWLQQEIAKLRTKVSEAETAVASYKVDNDLFVGGNATPVADQQVSTVATQVAEAQQRKAAAQSRSKVIRGLLAAGQSLDGVADIRDSAVIQSLLQTKANLQADLAQKSTTLLANHPTIKALKAQIREMEGQIAAEAEKVADSFDTTAKSEADLEQRLRDELTRAKLSAGDATRGSVTLDSLEREAKAQRDLLENYLAKYSDAVSRSASNAALPDVRVISEAAPSVEPASPKIPLILGAVGFVALALQVGAVLFGELMSGRALVERVRRGRSDTEAGFPENDEQHQTDVELPDDPLERAVAVAVADPAPAPPVNSDLAALSAAVSAHQLRTVLLATVGDGSESVPVVERLLEDAIVSELSAVVVDAGSGDVSAVPGLTDLAAETADYGDVMQKAGENLAEVQWGTLSALDRRSSRPLTLIEALADIYHVVIVDTGRAGMTSSLPLFTGARATVVLVAGESANPVAIAAARRDVAALGFTVGRVVNLSAARADVA